ncbi:YHYH domain-containing protein [Alcanivoracaceae bacterium MT1]
MKKKAITLLLLTLVSGAVLAHSGGTNSQGCHKNHKTGDYHCH